MKTSKTQLLNPLIINNNFTKYQNIVLAINKFLLVPYKRGLAPSKLQFFEDI